MEQFVSGEFTIPMDEEDLDRLRGSRHVGMPGERADFRGLKVFMSKAHEGNFGTVTILGFEDQAGNVLIWFASGAKPYKKGDVVALRATVKGYDESDGVRKTVVTMGAELAEKEERKWKACATGTRRR